MSYYEQGQQINTELKRFFERLKLDGGEPYIKELIDNILRFGQVAKFRCRSNSAYDGFVSVCFEGIVKTGRTPFLGKEGNFEVLQVTEVLI